MGIGISLYFRQLLFLFYVFMVLGCMSIPALYHNYQSNPKDTSPLLWGTVLGATARTLSFTWNGVVDIIVCVSLLLFALSAQKVEDMVAEQIDVSQQTAQDYSIVVLNPDPNLFDPDEYQKFFSKYGEVVQVKRWEATTTFWKKRNCIIVCSGFFRWIDYMRL